MAISTWLANSRDDSFLFICRMPCTH